MKKIILILFTFCLFVNFVYANNFIDSRLNGYRYKIIKYDLRDPSYKFKIGVNLDYNATSLKDLMSNFNGISAINGVFLCPADYSECGGKNFTKNERYFMGYKIGNEDSTGERVVFALNKNNEPFLYQTDKINYDLEKSIYYGFANFPLLLKSGESKVSDYKLDYKMKSKSKRNFICSDKPGDYIYTGYVYNISLEDLPDFLKKLGCYDALNLDAGKTSSMIYNGRQIIGPGRDLLDGVIIEKVGLDTKSIIKNIDEVMVDFKKVMDRKTSEKRVSLTNSILGRISDFRTNMYEKNSRDLFDEKNKKIGYEIRMNKREDLRIMFLINILESKILKLNKKYKKDYNKEKKGEDLLF